MLLGLGMTNLSKNVTSYAMFYLKLMLLGINFVACSPTSSTPLQLELFKVSFIVYLWPMLSGSLFVLQFFTSKPLPCDPSCLPKYPPSKEFDAKLRDEEARR